MRPAASSSWCTSNAARNASSRYSRYTSAGGPACPSAEMTRYFDMRIPRDFSNLFR